MNKKLRKKLLFFSCNHEAMLLCHHRANSVIVTFIFVILIFFSSKKFGDFGEDILNSGVIGASLYSDNDEEIQPNFVVITFRNKFTNVNITGSIFIL